MLTSVDSVAPKSVWSLTVHIMTISMQYVTYVHIRKDSTYIILYNAVSELTIAHTVFRCLILVSLRVRGIWQKPDTKLKFKKKTPSFYIHDYFNGLSRAVKVV